MKGLSLGIYVLWFVDVLFAFGTCWAIVKKGFRPHWKAFSYYLFFMAAQNLAFLPVYLFGNETAYEFTYYVGDFLEALLLSFVLLEILVKVLEPFEALPGRTVARFCFFTVLGVSTAVALSVVVPSHGHKLVVNFLTTVERTVFLAGAVILWVILLQAKALGISWKSAVAEISIAFVLYLTVGSARGFAMVLYNDHLAQDIAAGMGQFAYLIAMAGWIWTMTHRDPVSRPSPEAIERIRQLASGTEIVPRERILAAVGIRVEKSEAEGPSQDHEAQEEDPGAVKAKDSGTPRSYLVH
ncbi:MAG TPA: hypothetical protein VF532_01880 [Candidatus Angelobacter sp.]